MTGELKSGGGVGEVFVGVLHTHICTIISIIIDGHLISELDRDYLLSGRERDGNSTYKGNALFLRGKKERKRKREKHEGLSLNFQHVKSHYNNDEEVGEYYGKLIKNKTRVRKHKETQTNLFTHLYLFFQNFLQRNHVYPTSNSDQVLRTPSNKTEKFLLQIPTTHQIRR